MSDIIDTLVGHHLPARDARPQAVANAQLAFEALLENELPERYAIAAFVAGLHQSSAVEFYVDLLADENPELVEPIRAQIAAGLSTGPVGTYREPELAAESDDAFWFHAADVPPRLAAALDYAHLLVFHPRDCRPETISGVAAYYDETEIVLISQLISFLAFQLHLVEGLRVLDGTAEQPRADRKVGGEWGVAKHARVLDYPELARPTRFVRHGLGWQPWIAPLEKTELTEEHLDALIRPERADSPYFRLLVRAPEALKARTLVDLDIFYNTDTGIGRAERELAATVASRFNGCVFCASVHAGRAVAESTGREADIDRLLADGPAADLGSDLWNAIATFTRALSATPAQLTPFHVKQLRDLGLSDIDLVDIIGAAAFFNWANRLMLALGEPELPKRYR
ncbi:alkylhydroperoxidase domain protein [Staphylococcus chromogenes]|nr:alkylhydroperoxidase domain protein [Staphylococcus chromogenes]